MGSQARGLHMIVRIVPIAPIVVIWVITRLRKNLSANQMIMVDLLIRVDDSGDHMKRMPG